MEKATSSGRNLAAVAELYRGAFLDDFYLSEIPQLPPTPAAAAVALVIAGWPVRP